MLKTICIAVAAGAAALPAVAVAQAARAEPSSQTGIYVGLGAGVVNGRFEEANFAAPAGMARTEKTHEAGGKGIVGFRFHRHFAVEGGYYNFGKFESTYQGGGLTGQAVAKIDGWNLSALGVMPIGPNFSGFGRVGAFNSEVDTTVSGTVPAGLMNTSKRSTQLTWGLGGQWDINSRWALRGEYENFGKAGDASTGQLRLDMWSASALYKF